MDNAVQRLDGIRGVDCLANIRRIAEERIEIFPVRPPAFADLRIFIVPGTRERIQRHQRGFLCRSLIHRFQSASDGFVILPRHVFQAVAHHMDDAQLDVRLRINAVYRIREALQPVHAGNQDILKTPVFKLL